MTQEDARYEKNPDYFIKGLPYLDGFEIYAMNDPTGATLFKRRKAADAIRRTLGRGVDILECQTRERKGVRVPVLSSIHQRPRRRQTKE